MMQAVRDTSKPAPEGSVHLPDHALPAPALSRRFGVGEWLVYPDLNRLQARRSDIQRALEPRLMHLLCYLAANPDQVLTRETLVQELWPRVVVNENSLTRAVSELRKQLALSDRPGTAYIETIPKKGYRLIPAVDSLALPATPTRTARANGHRSWLPDWLSAMRYPVVALSLSLVFATWLGLAAVNPFAGPTGAPVLLADELLNQPAGYVGGELTLSTADNSESLASGIKHVEAPVISNDESQYAYIQHDNAGSTIFLGRLDALAAPVVPVFNSPDKLYNLTWSPLGHSLMFARQDKLTAAALFTDERASAELMQLDLITMQVQRLLPDTRPVEKESSKAQNLT